MSTSTRMLWLLSGAFVLTVLFTSCLKKDNIIGGPNNNGSIAEVKFEGETRKFSGLGSMNIVEDLIFSMAINDYKGPGRYLTVEENDKELTGVAFYKLVGEDSDFFFESLADDEFEVIIDRDNGRLISGSFSGIGEDEEIGAVGPFSGKFVVNKK